MTFQLTSLELAVQSALVDDLISRAEAEGLTGLDREAVAQLPAVRFSTLTRTELSPQALEQLRELVPEQLRAREINARLGAPDGPTQHMNPHQRLTWAHINQAPASTAKSKFRDAEAEAHAILALRRISDPVARLTAAREMGIV